MTSSKKPLVCASLLRIVSLVPSITEALCMLGLEDSICGITDYSLHPASVVSGKRRIGGTKNPRLSEIFELRPDLVIVNIDENRLQTHDALIAAGLNVLVTQTDSLDEVEAAWTRLGEATEAATRAREYRDRIAGGPRPQPPPASRHQTASHPHSGLARSLDGERFRNVRGVSACGVWVEGFVGCCWNCNRHSSRAVVPHIGQAYRTVNPTATLPVARWE